jgi:hypothetical protein
MSNKNLLNEATIRRFMKLADMEPLANPFVDRLDEMHCPSGGRDDDEEAMEERQKYGGNKGDESRSRRDYMEEGEYGGNKGDESRSRRDYMEEGEYGGNKGDESRSRRDYMNEDDDAEKLDATEDELSDMDAEADRERDEIDAMEDGALPADVRDRVEDALAGALEALAAELGDSLGVDLDVEAAPEEADMEVDMEMDAPAGGEEVEMDAEVEEMLEGIQVVDDTELINEVAKRVTARLVRAMAKK